ncbi:class I SAM-dependent methyltransferase [Nocardioides pantholopis]|uniref:class I SAM-dependent methyltransferase n=1 Tax=Nocardioides pantholopis TaxID=2483798 RepID=UPI000FD8C5B6|nr:class I SAM-dependent methyltransferase [Nocardioides pantholopis]
MTTRWERIARATNGEEYAAAYARRFGELAAAGQDVHGEATFVTGLVDPPARVLDAGCGTGRIAVRLDELGYRVVGVDVDATMLEQARAEAPGLDWRLGDLAAFDLGATFDVVLLAGNIVPLLEPGTLPAVCERLAAHTAAGGRVVCGFGLDADHLPAGCPVTPLAQFEEAMAAAGLDPVATYGTWDRGAFEPGAGYVVTVHGRAGGPGERA